MANLTTIVKAWSKVLREVTTDEDTRRASICSNCPSKKYSKFMDLVKDELEEVKGFVCTECGCPLIAKIRSTDKCKYWYMEKERVYCPECEKEVFIYFAKSKFHYCPTCQFIIKDKE